MVTTLKLFGAGWMTWTLLQYVLNYSTILKLNTTEILTLFFRYVCHYPLMV